MLTVKQEKFTINVFKGMTQRDAYIDAYHPKSTNSVIDVSASQLVSTPKIQMRLAELRAPLISAAIASETERQEKLTELYRTPVERKPTPKEVVMAISEHNKMTRVYTTPEVGVVMVNSFTFVLPDGTKVSPKQLIEIGGENGSNRTGEEGLSTRLHEEEEV